MSELLRLLAVLVLIAANAFFVVGEYAVVTARRSALAPRAAAGSAGARAALRLMDDPVRVISTVQVGITADGILLGALAEPVVRELFGEALPEWLTFVIAFSVVTYLSVVRGELVPKALTLDRAETLASMVARPIELLSVLLRPVVWVLQGSAKLLLQPFGVEEVIAGESIRTPAELRALIEEVQGSGVIPRAQEELLHNVFEFVDREVVDVMVPALDVDWIDASLTADAALERVLESPHERYPVSDGALDRLEGVVHVRDLLAGSRGDGGTQTVRELARPIFAVPENKDVGALLRELRERREQLAAVLDEYGRRRRHRRARGHPRGARRRDRRRVRPSRQSPHLGRRANRARLGLHDHRRLQRGGRHAAAPSACAHAGRGGAQHARPPAKTG